MNARDTLKKRFMSYVSRLTSSPSNCKTSFKKSYFPDAAKMTLLTSGSHPHFLSAIIWFKSSSHGEVLTGSSHFKNRVIPSSVRSRVHCQAAHACIRQLMCTPMNLCLPRKKRNSRQSGEPDPLNSGRKEACNQVIAQKCSMCF